MKVIDEISLRDFEFWSGAVETKAMLTDGQLDTIEDILVDINPEGMTSTQINDFFWFDRDTIAEWLGYRDWEDLEGLE